MKKRIFLLLMVTAVCMAFAWPCAAGAEALVQQSESCGENATWELKNAALFIHGTGAIFDYNENETPWHTEESKIKSVTIDEGITEIGNRAFEDLKIIKAELPSTLVRIGERAFSSTNLSAVNLPEGLKTIEDYAFAYCYKLRSVKLPSSLETLGNDAFVSCYRMTDLTIAEGALTILPEWAFSNTKIKSVSIPEGVILIEEKCFDDTPVTSVGLPASIETIGEKAFNDCTKLKKVTYAGTQEQAGGIQIDNGNEYLTAAEWTCSDGKGGALKEASNTCGENATWETKGAVLYINGTGPIDDYSETAPPWGTMEKTLRNVVIGEGITAVGDKAFNDMKITQVQLPSTLTRIGARAFANTNLNGIELPDGLKEIGEEAFYWCTRLKNVSLPESVTSVGREAFYMCRGIGKITLSPNLAVLDEYVFYRIKARDVVIPEGVATINKSCFRDTGIANISLPSTLEAVGEDAFAECKNLKKVTYAGTLAEAQNILMDSGNSYLTAAEWTCSDGKYAALETVSNKCGDDVTWEIKNTALYISGTGPMDDFEENETPWYTSSKTIRAVVIGEGVTEIGNNAFNELKITKADLPSTLVRIGKNAFESTRLNALTLPDGLETIESEAFYWCPYIRSISIPDTVTAIGDKAFYYCKNANRLKLSAGLKSLGSYAFYYCGERDLVIPEGLNTIGSGCFYRNTKLVNLELPASIQMVEENAFEDCKKLNKVTFNGTQDEAMQITIDNGNSYLTAAAWSYK